MLRARIKDRLNPNPASKAKDLIDILIHAIILLAEIGEFSGTRTILDTMPIKKTPQSVSKHR